MVWLIVPFVVGNLLYAFAREWWEVLVARFLVGLSATVSTVGRAWVPRVAKDKSKQAALVGLMSAATTLGFGEPC